MTLCSDSSLAQDWFEVLVYAKGDKVCVGREAHDGIVLVSALVKCIIEWYPYRRKWLAAL